MARRLTLDDARRFLRAQEKLYDAMGQVFDEWPDQEASDLGSDDYPFEVDLQEQLAEVGTWIQTTREQIAELE